MESKLGYTLAGIYVLVVVFLIVTQGLFGESFIALILGLLWVLFLTMVPFGSVGEVFSFIAIILPMVLNALVLYGIGFLIERWVAKRKGNYERP